MRLKNKVKKKINQINFSGRGFVRINGVPQNIK